VQRYNKKDKQPKKNRKNILKKNEESWLTVKMDCHCIQCILLPFC